MTTTNQLIVDLWRYLEIRPNETLIVQRTNPVTKQIEYVMATQRDKEIDITVSDALPPLGSLGDFQLIKHRDKHGNYTIPSAKQLQEDKLNDY